MTTICNMVPRLKDKQERKTPYSLVFQIIQPPTPIIVVFFSVRHKLFKIFVYSFMQKDGLSNKGETTLDTYTEVWNS